MTKYFVNNCKMSTLDDHFSQNLTFEKWDNPDFRNMLDIWAGPDQVWLNSSLNA